MFSFESVSSPGMNHFHSLFISIKSYSLPAMGEKDTFINRNLVRKGENREFLFSLLFLNFLKLKRITMPKWHIVWWHILTPFTCFRFATKSTPVQWLKQHKFIISQLWRQKFKIKVSASLVLSDLRAMTENQLCASQLNPWWYAAGLRSLVAHKNITPITIVIVEYSSSVCGSKFNSPLTIRTPVLSEQRLP